ncbi:HIT family protein [Actinoplanes subtropicus]|uniref:HIT family protein n=1 Tax=Actinoplanes subtropicus TaxID=543632 RepID=UPI0004C401AA|nr:HIT family protein [Actinoplanes subtropicus]
MADCVFCAIVAGSVPAFKVVDVPSGVGFLDTRPVFKGHVLVVPRQHVVTLPDLPSADLPGYFGLVQRVAAAVPAALGSTGTFVAINNIVSQSVPHLHTHVVPRTKGDGLKGFFWPRTRYASDDEAADYAAKIASELG